VNFPKQQASITVVVHEYDQKALMKALEKEGFQAKVLKESTDGGLPSAGGTNR
jgi:hypothetical protein